jgi:hypothetical protein
MQFQNITSEGDLRTWMRSNISECEGRVKIEWIEPSLYGSSIGMPDCKIVSEDKSIGLELKYLELTRKGIRWTVRPVQRRYHRMLAIRGGRSALLAYIAGIKELVLVRGDHVPLRNYASDPNSGVEGDDAIVNNLSYFSIDKDRQTMFNLEEMLFHNSDFWKIKDKVNS